MKILMLTPYLPYPPASGGQIRTLNLLKYLSQKHEITLVSLYKNKVEKQFSSYLKPFCKNVYVCKRAEKPWQWNIISKALFTLKPLLIVRNFSLEAQHLLKNLLKNERFDVIHAETFYIMPHLPKTNIPILLVEQTIEYQVYQHFVKNLFFIFQPFFYLDILKLKYWEKYYWKKANIVAAVSEADQTTIKNIEPSINPVIVRNGAGDEMWSERPAKKNIKETVLLFQGNFSWLQNIEAATYLIKKIYPLLDKAKLRYKLIIAGQETKKILLKNNPNIEIEEIDSKKSNGVKKIYGKSDLFIAPIFGPGGTRLKILAAMASGLPVISTTIGIEGLSMKDDEHVLIANSAKEFITQIKRIISDKNLYERIRKNSYLLARAKYSWNAISQHLETVYQSLVKK